MEPPKAPGKLALFVTLLKKLENVAAFFLYFAGLSLFTFIGGQLYNEFQEPLGLFYSFFFIFPVISFKKKELLKNVFSKIFFTSALILIVSTGIFFSFHIITSIGFIIISLIAVPTFTFLYSWVEKSSKQTGSNLHKAKNRYKIISTIFVLAGIVFLVFSLAFTSHIEQKLGTASHHEFILSQDFNLIQPIPDTTLSVNLTTQDRLAYGIYPASYPHQKGYSSIDFSISYRPVLGDPLVKVYERSNISSRTSDGSGGWSVTQNGTYILNLHYNYNETIHVNENIGKYWSTIEPVPTTVYTPLLADYMAPILIISLALLIVSVSIPILQLLKTKSLKNEHYNEFATPPPPPPEM